METPSQPTSENGLAGKYLTFDLGSEVYGIEILRVREIIGVMETTDVPRSPAHVLGVINLRGKIIPVMDLRRRFDMEHQTPTDRACTIVVDNTDGGSMRQIGLVVDGVCEVLDIRPDQIDPPPEFGNDVPYDFVQGLGKCEDGVKILLSIDAVLGNFDELNSQTGASLAAMGS